MRTLYFNNCKVNSHFAIDHKRHNLHNVQLDEEMISNKMIDFPKATIDMMRKHNNYNKKHLKHMYNFLMNRSTA